ncbi:MAG: hypothetical protein WCW13_03895 [archaeon]|jgi:hypothetical protein
MRGQVAFEGLLLLLVIITLASGIGALYMRTHNDTMAIAIAREEVLSQLSTKTTTNIIDYVQLEKEGPTINILIKITPRTTIDTEILKQKVKAATNYQTNIILQ